jgi:hypothetical protein
MCQSIGGHLWVQFLSHTANSQILAALFGFLPQNAIRVIGFMRETHGISPADKSRAG